MATVTGDFNLTHDELRVVASYVAESAQRILPVFEAACPDDLARAPISTQHGSSSTAHLGPSCNGSPRWTLTRAAQDAPTEAARLAAIAAGDAASAAYLHPIAKGHQVGHILRAAANEHASPRSKLAATPRPRRS